jgi:hypothetical protein
MPETGSAELVWMFIGVVPWLVPIAAGISAVITLHRIHPGQKSFQSRLDEIEAAVRQNLSQQ